MEGEVRNSNTNGTFLVVFDNGAREFAMEAQQLRRVDEIDAWQAGDNGIEEDILPEEEAERAATTLQAISRGRQARAQHVEQMDAAKSLEATDFSSERVVSTTSTYLTLQHRQRRQCRQRHYRHRRHRRHHRHQRHHPKPNHLTRTRCTSFPGARPGEGLGAPCDHRRGCFCRPRE